MKIASGKPKYLLIFIIITAFLVRFINLSGLPSNLNRDELAIGYNAYSIVETQKDEHGAGPWPLTFKSFGDYKLPGLIYLVSFSTKMFGLKELTVRLPNAFFGSLLIPLIYLLGQELFKKNHQALYLTVLLALSFWHLHGSRSAYEPIVALTFSTTGLLFLLKGRRRPIFTCLSVIPFALSFYIYNAPLILAPFIFLAVTVIFSPDYRKHKKATALAAVLLILNVMLAFKLTSSVGQAKLHTTIFNQPQLQSKVETRLHQLRSVGFPKAIAQIFVNQPVEMIYQSLMNYSTAFNPHYLFFTGDDNPWHNLANINFGNFNIFILPLFLLGLYSIFKSGRLQKSHRLILALLLLSPLPNAISIDAPITNRLMDFHLAILMVASLGVAYLISSPKASFRAQAIRMVIIAGYFAVFIHFLISYSFLHSRNLPGFWKDRIKDLVIQVSQIEDNYNTIFVNDEIDLGYIYFVFYARYDPQLFQQQAQWLDNGLSRVRRLGKYVFDPIPNEFALFPEHENRDFIKPYLAEKPHKILVIDQARPLVTNAVYPIIVRDLNNIPVWQAKEISIKGLSF